MSSEFEVGKLFTHFRVADFDAALAVAVVAPVAMAMAVAVAVARGAKPSELPPNDCIFL